jgi:hypothetical protein
MTSSTSAKRANKQPRFSECYSFAADDHGPYDRIVGWLKAVPDLK